MKLSEWKLKMTDGVTSVLSKISGMSDKVSHRFSGLQDKISKVGDGARKSGFQIPFLSGAFSRLEGMAGQASGAVGGMVQSLVSMKHPVALIAAAVIALGAALVIPINKAGDFQQTMAEVSAITGIAGNDLKHLADRSLEVGASTGLGAMKAAEAYKLLASNIDVATIGGIKGLDQLQEKTIILAQAAGVDLPTAANTMAATINQFSLKASEAGRVINTLAAGAKFGAAEIPDLAESLKITGSTAAIAKVSLEDTVGALEILSQNAIKGSEAGTGLRNVLLALQTKTKFLPGIDLRADGLSKTLVKLKPHLKDTVLLAHLFGRENINAAQLLIKNAQAVDEMGKKVKGTNTAYEQAAINQNTFNGAMLRFKETMNSTFIRIGTIFLEPLKKGFDFITGGVNKFINILSTVWHQSELIRDSVWLIGKAFQFLGKYTELILVTPLKWVWSAYKWFFDKVEWMYEKAKRLLGLKDTKTNAGQGQLMSSLSGGVMDVLGKPTDTGAKAGSVDEQITEATGRISEGGRTVKNVTVNLKSLVEHLNITPATLKEGTDEIVRIVEETLLRAIRGGELAAYND